MRQRYILPQANARPPHHRQAHITAQHAVSEWQAHGHTVGSAKQSRCQQQSQLWIALVRLYGSVFMVLNGLILAISDELSDEYAASIGGP
jgi:hypothetical protein